MTYKVCVSQAFEPEPLVLPVCQISFQTWKVFKTFQV